MKRVFRSIVFYIVLAVAALLVATSVLRHKSDRQHVSLTSLEASIAHHDVVRAQVLDGDDKVRADLRDGAKVEVSFLNRAGPDLTRQLLDSGAAVEVRKHHDNALLSLFLSSLPILLLLVGFVFILNMMQGGGNRVMQFGKAKARTVSKDQPKVTFADVAGADEAVAELQEIKEFLEAPAKFQAMGAKIPKGVLLFGPPGTGKTLLARAVAGEAGAPFFSISGADFVGMFRGVGASRGRDLFELAKRSPPAVDLGVLARRRPGFTGADLANLMNEAALLSARHNRREIGMRELEEAIDRVIAGPERKTRVMSDREKQVIAYHEGGHALVGHVLPNADPVHKVSIVARGRALGWTLALPIEDRYIVTRSELTDQLTVLMGGRTAEELMFLEPTTGAQNDIEKATDIARAMVTEYGMSELLGP